MDDEIGIAADRRGEMRIFAQIEPEVTVILADIFSLSLRTQNHLIDDILVFGAFHPRQNAIELTATEMPSVFVDLEANLMNSDRARQLKAAFEKLNEKQRLVIELAYFEGLSQTEMAERMKQPLGTVKTWVRTALQILRNELEEAVPA